MQKVVKFVATVEEGTGRILNIQIPQATLEPEGTQDGRTVVHVTEDRMTPDFMSVGWNPMLHLWDGQQFVHVGTPPNRHAIYNGTDWEWDQQLLIDDVRTARTRKLQQSDWTQLPDSAISDDEKLAWQQYRQQLRDFMGNLPSEFDSVSGLNWPVQP